MYFQPQWLCFVLKLGNLKSGLSGDTLFSALDRFNLNCSLGASGATVPDLSKYPLGLNDEDKARVDNMLINITNANTDALASAVENMQFSNIDQVFTQQNCTKLCHFIGSLTLFNGLSKTPMLDGLG